MNDILAQLSSPVFWVCVVLTGLLINLASAYTKPALDRIGSRISRARRKRFVAKQRRLDRAVDYLLSNPNEVTDLKLDRVGLLLGILLFCLMAVLVALAAQFLHEYARFLREYAYVATVFRLIVYAEGWVFVAQGALFVAVALGIAMGVRRYLALGTFLAAYRRAAHTAVSRLLTDDYPPEDSLDRSAEGFR